jgi:hypothetical protein
MRARVTYERPASPWRRKVHTLATSSALEYAMLACIVLNAVFMGMEHFHMSAKYVGILSDANLTLTVIFTIEAVIKLVRACPSLLIRATSNAEHSRPYRCKRLSAKDPL